MKLYAPETIEFLGIGADPSNFRQNKLTDRVSSIDYDSAVRKTLHTILWSQDRILADPFKIDPRQCSDRVSDANDDCKVSSPLHTIPWRQESNSDSQRQIRILAGVFEFH